MQTEVACELLVDGQAINYRGEALEWDLSAARNAALLFTAPWFAERVIKLSVWATSPVKLDCFVTSGDMQPVSVYLGERINLQTVASVITIPVRAKYPNQSGELRVSLTASGVSHAATKIYIGSSGTGSSVPAVVRARLAPNAAFRHYISTWLILLSISFLALSLAGFRGTALLVSAIPFFPKVLEGLGAKWASTFDADRLALFLWNKSSQLWLRVIPAIALVMFSFVAYIGAALLSFTLFERQLEDQLSKAYPTYKERAQFFCNYPERVEARAMLAKALYIRSDPNSSNAAYEAVLNAIQNDRREFLASCMSAWRVFPYFLENRSRMQEDAKIFYAGVLWGSIDTIEQFDARMKDIREVLAGDNLGAQRDLALAKYELKYVKNVNEQRYCAGSAEFSEQCANRKSQCVSVRTALEKLLDRPSGWSPSERRSISYIEARDVAATAHMSYGCSYETEEDILAVISHYRALLGALPRDYAHLDQYLTQLNIRKFIDSLQEDEPAHKTSDAWKRECKTHYPKTCTRLRNAFFKDGKQTTFFSDDPEKRLAQWGRPSLPFLEGDEFVKRIRDERLKNWSWPI